VLPVGREWLVEAEKRKRRRSKKIIATSFFMMISFLQQTVSQ
jgi:hypothetical protein